MLSIEDMISHGCVVTLHKNFKTYKRQPLSSCSGVLIDSQNGIVLTHGSLFSAISHTEQKRILCSENDSRSFITDISQFYSADVILDVRENRISKGSFSCNAKNNSHLMYKTFQAQLIDVIYCESFHNSLQHYMGPPSVWSFSEGFQNCLPYFVILKILDWKLPTHHKAFCIKPSFRCKIGDMVEVYSTPFGNHCPEVFLNSVSRGVISNCFGQNQVHLLTDARCISGSPGGLLCSIESDGQRCALGIVVSPFCWKERYWVGLTLVCSISEILSHLFFSKLQCNRSFYNNRETCHLTSLPVSLTPSSFSFLQDMALNKDSQVSMVTKILPNVCRVISKLGNGSGIVFGPDLILTCRHVINADTKVTVKLYGETDWRDAVVEYATPNDDPLDLAVLSLDDSTTILDALVPIETAQAIEGMNIYAIGHALFSSTFDSSPSITSGTVSRLVYHEGKPLLIQSSCALYPGSSGGPVVNDKGQLISISRSNVVMLNDNPHVSISIPVESIMPILKEYSETKNVTVLKKLWLQDEDSRRLWQLKSFPESRRLNSKL